jgi:hypothetical protein
MDVDRDLWDGLDLATVKARQHDCELRVVLSGGQMANTFSELLKKVAQNTKVLESLSDSSPMMTTLARSYRRIVIGRRSSSGRGLFSKKEKTKDRREVTP